MLIGSLLLHAALLLLFLGYARVTPPPEPLPPQGVAMLFESGSPTGPAAPRPDHGQDLKTTPATPATAPPAPVGATAAPPPVPVPPAPLPPTLAPQSAATPFAPAAPAIPETASPSAPPPAASPQSAGLLPIPMPPPAVAAPPAAAPPAAAPPIAAPPIAAGPALPRIANQPPRPAIPRTLPRPAPLPLQRAEPRREPRPVSPFAAPMEFSFGNTRPAPGSSDAIGPSAAENERRATGRIGDSIQSIGQGNPGGDWFNALQGWMEAHKYYPREAALNGEDGVVVVHVIVDRSGHVDSVELRSRSGSQWLDLGAQAMFRGAHLPAFPANTPYPDVDLNVTMHYIIIRR